MRNAARLYVIPVLFVAIMACAVLPTSETTRINDVPHVRQKPDFCGEACVEMYLRKIGYQVTQDDVFNMSGVDPALGRGCYSPELARTLRTMGFKTGSVGYKVKVAKLAEEMEEQWQAILNDLQQDIPSLVCMRTSPDPRTSTEHIRLILGYDADKDEVIYHEPAENNGAYQRMARKQFIQLWPLKYAKTEWTVIRFRLETDGRLKLPKVQTGYTNATFAQHVMKLRDKLPSKDFSILIEPPFAVVGDEPIEVLRKHRAEGTVRWATKALKKTYFTKNPGSIYDIWLFKNKVSYEKNALKLFGEKPTTPYGYCSDEHHALVMNIATGGGTLVHEMVHAFMETNFPKCPAWFNEGMGSLYEQCRAGRNGMIEGATNWRLAGLQEAIKAKEVPSFSELTHTTSYEFYQQDKGTNYAQARYLCYYLQEHGLLLKFYRAFLKNHRTDPTGYKTLVQTLGEKDMAAFKTKWETYVMKLRFG